MEQALPKGSDPQLVPKATTKGEGDKNALSQGSLEDQTEGDLSKWGAGDKWNRRRHGGQMAQHPQSWRKELRLCLSTREPWRMPGRCRHGRVGVRKDAFVWV